MKADITSKSIRDLLRRFPNLTIEEISNRTGLPKEHVRYVLTKSNYRPFFESDYGKPAYKYKSLL